MKNVTVNLVTIIFLIGSFFIGCGEQKKSADTQSSVSAEDIKKEVKDVVETASAFTEQQKEEYQNQIEEKLKEYGEKIDDMIAQIDNIKKSASEELKREIAILRNKKEDVSKKIDAIKIANSIDWEELKVGIDNALADLEKALERASVAKGS